VTKEATSFYEPTEGGPDKLLCDIGYYARRLGLGAEEFKLQTEDGFVISLSHFYDPKEYIPALENERAVSGPASFTNEVKETRDSVKQHFKKAQGAIPFYSSMDYCKVLGLTVPTMMTVWHSSCANQATMFGSGIIAAASILNTHC
jgi:hypothetical protein